jgi:hypothetical protein
MDKTFSPVLRTELEENPNGFNLAILGAIQEIESKARTLKKTGVKNVRVQLSPDIDNLVSRVAMGNKNNSMQCYQAINEIKQKWEVTRDRKPNDELARIRRAELAINAMNNEEIEEKILNYGNVGSVDIGYEESQILLSRATGATREILQDTIKKNCIDKPFLKSPPERELLTNAEKYGSLGAKMEHDGMIFEVEKVIDLEDELSAEVN